MVVAIFQSYAAFIVAVMVIYALRHWYFTMNRLWTHQRPYYRDLYDSELPPITVVVPMHNEASVATGVIDALLSATYPRDRLEIAPLTTSRMTIRAQYCTSIPSGIPTSSSRSIYLVASAENRMRSTSHSD